MWWVSFWHTTKFHLIWIRLTDSFYFQIWSRTAAALSTLYFLNTLNHLGSHLLSRRKSDGLCATCFPPPCSEIKHWWKAVDGCTVMEMRKNGFWPNIFGYSLYSVTDACSMVGRFSLIRVRSCKKTYFLWVFRARTLRGEVKEHLLDNL